MAESTPLDAAHAAMTAAPGDTGARLAFYERLAATELFLLLAEEAAGARLSPETVELEGTTCVMVFDREARLTALTGRAAPYAALSGRTVAVMLDGQGLGLALNPGVAPSAFVMPAPAVAWLAEAVSHVPERIDLRMRAFHPPAVLPEALLRGLDARLATAGGLARTACLAEVTHADGTRGGMLAFLDALPGAEPALARLVAEALALSGQETAVLDVGFLRADEPAARRLLKVALRFDLPQPRTPPERGPGTDPATPPRLR